ncbi:MAG: outer membrane beta-barrel protein [Paludibacter sp.]|nr:outer membrane beta-barrel protein [Paludibacter sp.]
MRKFIIPAIILLFSTQLFSQYSGYPTYPQTTLPKINMEQFTFGLKLSPNISWVGVQHNDAIADGATLKIGGGIVANYEINKLLSVVTGVNYNLTGGYLYDSLSLNNPLTKDNYRVNYSAVEVPLGLRLSTPTVDKTSYYLQGGVNTSFILTASEKHKSSLPNTKLPALDIIPLTSTSAVGFFAGVGIERQILRKFSIFAEMNYKQSLSSFSNGIEYVNPTNPLYDHGYNQPISIFPAAMEFSVGVMF